MDREMSELPDRMTGDDLVKQENYEMGFERQLFNNMDRVDRRDRRNHIISMTVTDSYRNNYSKINWR